MKRQPAWVVPVALCLLVIVVYANGFANGIAGDIRGLLQDTRVHQFSAENLGLIFSHTYWWPYGESGLYRPVTTLSYLFNYAIIGGGESTAGYHAVNLLLHCLNVLLVWILARRLGLADLPAAFLAAIWAVHPVLTESVTNLAGRPDLLAGACVLGGFWCYLEKRWIALGAVTLVGALSKESAVTLLGIIVLYEICFGNWRTLLWPVVAMIIPIQVMLYLRAAALYSAPPVEFPFWDNPLVGADFLTARLTALDVLGRYVGLLLWPARLSSDYSWAQIRPSASVLGVVVLLALAAALYFSWRNHRMTFFLLAAALLTLLPSSNLLFPIGTIMAERFLYLPAIAFAAFLASLLARVPRFAPAAAAIIVVALSARTFARNPDWQSDLTLGKSAVQTAPESYKSHKLFANALFEAKAPIDQVLAESDKMLAILEPLPPLRQNADSWRRAANWYLAKGDAHRAIDLLQHCQVIVAAQEEHARALPRFDPATNPIAGARDDVNRLISTAYLQLGDASKALTTDSENPDVWRREATGLAEKGRGEDAIIALMEGTMLTMDPSLRQAVVELYRQGFDPHHCALLPGQDGRPALNPACDTVHTHLCKATLAAIDLREKTGKPALADQLRTTASRDFKCQ